MSFDNNIAAIADQLGKQFIPAKRPTSDKWAFTFLPVGLHPNPQLDYAIVTEMTDEGRKLPTPSFDHPVYYISQSMGQNDVGDSYAGMKDIPYEYLQTQLTASLASNGYRSVAPKHPDHMPTQVLFFVWGMHNTIEIPKYLLSSSISRMEWRDSDWWPEYRQNMLSRAKTIGGQKFANEYAAAFDGEYLSKLSARDDTTGMLVYAVGSSCYYLIVTACDLEALKSNQRKVLWITRISTVSRGVNFKATLPVMIHNASYYFGRETPPEFLRKRAYKKARVDIGEATVVDYITGTSGTTSTTGTTTRASGENSKFQSPNPK